MFQPIPNFVYLYYLTFSFFLAQPLLPIRPEYPGSDDRSSIARGLRTVPPVITNVSPSIILQFLVMASSRIETSGSDHGQFIE